jgi:uncharacterized protein YkwD
LRKVIAISILLGTVAVLGPVAQASACAGEAKSPSKLSRKVARGAVLCLINQRRNHAGLGNLTEDSHLNGAATGHTKAMVKHNSYAHGNPLHRIRASGYLAGASTWTVGENLGWGPRRWGSPRRVVTSWMRSPEHRAVLLGGFRDIGIGVSKGAPFAHFGHNAATYTVDLGARN